MKRELLIGSSERFFYIKVEPPFDDEQLQKFDQPLPSHSDQKPFEWTWSDLAQNSRGVQVFGFEHDRIQTSKHLRAYARKLIDGMEDTRIHPGWFEVDTADTLPKFIPAVDNGEL